MLLLVVSLISCEEKRLNVNSGDQEKIESADDSETMLSALIGSKNLGINELLLMPDVGLKDYIIKPSGFVRIRGKALHEFLVNIDSSREVILDGGIGSNGYYFTGLLLSDTLGHSFGNYFKLSIDSRRVIIGSEEEGDNRYYEISKESAEVIKEAVKLILVRRSDNVDESIPWSPIVPDGDVPDPFNNWILSDWPK